MPRAGVAAILAAFVLLLGAGAAAAVSDGQYDPPRQHCSYGANSTANDAVAEDGCSNAFVGVSGASGPEVAYVGMRQTAEGQTIDPSNPMYEANTPKAGLVRTTRLYLGADDNLNSGEHDGSPTINNGPSDGGAIVANYDIRSFAPWFKAIRAGNIAYLLHYPVPLIDAGLGACADGVCAAATTEQRVAYRGTAGGSQPVADYSGKQWDPEACAGPSDADADCGPGGIGRWHSKDGTRTTEPGVQVYEDPDPQGSPVGPYPLPALYAGTCGVIAGGGPAATAPESPATNSAGQLSVGTACA